MAVNSRTYSLTGDAAATQIAKYTDQGVGVPGAYTVVMIDNSSGNTVYIGQAGVTDGTNGAGAAATNAGFPVKTATQVTFILQSGEKLYAFAHTTSTITVTVNGQ